MKEIHPPPLLAVRAIIRDDAGKILILKRSDADAYGNLWCLPGGKVDYGQPAIDALIREVAEELSLACTSVLFLFYMDGLPSAPGDPHYLTLFFSCQVTGTIKLNWESSDFAWVGHADLGNYEFAFNNDKAIRTCP
jgi:mutator protein MutT